MSATVDLGERFPPLFRPQALGPRQDAQAQAVTEAARAGAGAVFYGERAGQIGFSVVLEPEEALSAARRVLFCGMNALAETIAAEAPPERPLAFRYPGVVLFDAGVIGGLRLSWPEGAEDAPPEWLVLAGTIRRSGVTEALLRHDPLAMSLEEAGLGDIVPQAFVARFCRHLMAEIDEWQHVGFKGVGQRYLRRLEGGGGLRGIESNGDLVEQADGARRRTAFIAALAGEATP